MPTLDLPDGPFDGPVPDSGQICSNLLMDTCGVLMVLPAEAGLLLLVDDLVEKLVKEDNQPLRESSDAGT